MSFNPHDPESWIVQFEATLIEIEPAIYLELLEAWRDPDHDEHAAIRRWTGRRFNPERVDLAATGRAVTSAFRRAKGGYAHRRSQ